MARSLWKGRVSIKDFQVALYGNQLKRMQILTQEKLSSLEINSCDLKIYGRNHSMLPSQQKALTSLLPFYLYNGYDFFKQLSIIEVPSYSRFLNIGSQVLTREINVKHKAKVVKIKGRTVGVKKKVIKNTLLKKKKQNPVQKTSLAKQYSRK